MQTETMRAALSALDRHLDEPLRLIIGGGGAMVLAYDHPVGTHDIDAFPAKGGISLAELDAAAKRAAVETGVPSDWLNAHFATFTHVLPSDYGQRLRKVFEGAHLTAEALGPEDLLVMKCFSARDKDRPHAVRLLGLIESTDIVSRQLDLLIEKRVPGAERAADYFDDLCDELDR